MSEKKPNCFVIMPISDQEGYEKGHFSRVYDYLIKPACEQAGFNAIRADDEVKTNYIVVEIIKKILDSEIVLCDLSAKNPNVLYELGLRQAFNKKSLLIKDIKTTRIFDIQGLRTIEYDESLRIDSVQKNTTSIAKSLKETFESKENDINSLIQLLSIKPAKLSESFELSNESSLILKSLKDIQTRLNSVESNSFSVVKGADTKKISIDGKEFEVGWELYRDNKHLGTVLEVSNDKIIAIDKNNGVLIFKKEDANFASLDCYPF